MAAKQKKFCGEYIPVFKVGSCFPKRVNARRIPPTSLSFLQWSLGCFVQSQNLSLQSLPLDVSSPHSPQARNSLGSCPPSASLSSLIPTSNDLCLIILSRIWQGYSRWDLEKVLGMNDGWARVLGRQWHE